MKPTIDIEDEVLKKAKSVARKRNSTLKEVVEEALRQSLGMVSSAHKIDLSKHTYGKKGFAPRFSAEDPDQLRKAALAFLRFVRPTRSTFSIPMIVII